MHFNQFNNITEPQTHELCNPKDKTMSTQPEHLYHVLLTISHFTHDPNSKVEKLRMVGSYVDIKHAKAAAYRCLFESGFHKEWFEVYETDPARFAEHNLPQNKDLVVLAIAPNKTTFQVRILTSTNDTGFSSPFEDGRIAEALYHVLRTTVHYEKDENGEVRDTTLQGTFAKYSEARQYATKVLRQEDNHSEESFAEYEEAAPNERDCGYGENVIVHAVSSDGKNYLVSIVQSQELESVRLAEASMRIR